MKIAFLNIYNGLVNRGAERSTFELTKRLAEKFEITLIQGGRSNGTSRVKTITYTPLFPNFPDTSFSWFRKLYLDPWSIEILIFTLRVIPHLIKSRYQIIVPVNGGWQSLIIKVISIFTKAKLMIVGRAGIGRDDHFNLLLRPDIFIALSRHALDWANRIAPGTNIRFIPNGVDTEEFSPFGRIIKTGLRKPIILTVGSLTPNKQIQYSIKAVSRIPTASFLIVGRGPQKEELEKLAEELLGNNRFKIIDVPLNSMPDYYRIAKVFTLCPIREEAFGNVYLEALASNIPVVATNDGTRREIVGDAGLFVDPKNTDQYSKLLQKAIGTDYRDIPRKQAERYAWRKIIKEYEEVISRLS